MDYTYYKTLQNISIMGILYWLLNFVVNATQHMDMLLIKLMNLEGNRLHQPIVFGVFMTLYIIIYIMIYIL